MECREAGRLIHAFLDAEIDEQANGQLQEHMLACIDCRVRLHELQKAIAFVQSASHARPSADFTERVMAQLPAATKGQLFGNWLRQHPVLTAAAVFLMLMAGSLVTSCVERDSTLQVSSDNLDKLKIDQERHVVLVPAGETVNGDLIVHNGSVEVQGKVTGNVVAIDGKVFLASTAQVVGDAESIEAIFDWIWYEVKNIGNDLLPMAP